jgi:hypothetical protein
MWLKLEDGPNVRSIHHFSAITFELVGILPDLTLGELLSLHQILDGEINRLLNLQPISDTLDLRYKNIRKESYSYEDSNLHESSERESSNA